MGASLKRNKNNNKFSNDNRYDNIMNNNDSQSSKRERIIFENTFSSHKTSDLNKVLYSFNKNVNEEIQKKKIFKSVNVNYFSKNFDNNLIDNDIDNASSSHVINPKPKKNFFCNLFKKRKSSGQNEIKPIIINIEKK